MGKPIGTEGPLSFESAAGDGSWVVYCQARKDSNSDGRIEARVGPGGELIGDALTRWFSLGSGHEVAIDDVLARSEDDSRALLRMQGRLFLLENQELRELELPNADLRFEPGSQNPHRTLALVESTLFWVRMAGNRSELLARDLRTGEDRVEHALRGPIIRFQVHDSGARLVLQVPGADANNNGRFDWPFVPQRHPHACVGPIPRLMAPIRRSDPLHTVLLNRRTGSHQSVDNLIVPFGDGALRRDPNGALILERAGRARAVADSNCAGRVLWADPKRDQMLIGCAAPKKSARLQVELVHAFVRTGLDFDVAALEFDEPLGTLRRLVPLYPGADAVLFDLELQKLHWLRRGDQVLHASETKALVRRGRRLIVFNAERSTESVLPGMIDPLGELLVQGDLVYITPFVVDTALGRLLGRVPGPGLSLTRNGEVLTPTQAADATTLARGPLRWRTPVSR